MGPHRVLICIGMHKLFTLNTNSVSVEGISASTTAIIYKSMLYCIQSCNMFVRVGGNDNSEMQLVFMLDNKVQQQTSISNGKT